MSITKTDLDTWGHRLEAKLDDRFLVLTGLIGQLAQTVANNEARRKRDLKDFAGTIGDLATHMDERFDELVPRVDDHEQRIGALERRSAN